MCYNRGMQNPRAQSVYSVFNSIFPIRPVKTWSIDENGRTFIPNEIKKSLWLEKVFNRNVQVYRDGECVFNWPARKM